MIVVDMIVFQGITYRRYPNAKNWADKNYYRCNIAAKRLGYSYLHRDTYRAQYGNIPKGYEVHHKDHNALNNAIDNLELQSIIEHHKIHIPTSKQRQAIALKKHHAKMIQASKSWHRSVTGRQWHSEQAKINYSQRIPSIRLCRQCGNNFDCITYRDSDIYCSNSCKSKARRDSGIDNVDRVCIYCGSTFNINKYTKTQHCSRSCRSRNR
jgi:hypothetical protein